MKISSYITNEDNNSADKAETIKRIKKTLNQSESQASVVDDAGTDGTSTPHHAKSNKLPNKKACKASKCHIVDSDPPDPDTDVEEVTKEPADVEDAEDAEDAEIEVPEEDAEQELGKFVCQYFKHGTDSTYLAE